MVHPVKTPLGVVRGTTRVSLDAVRHPLRTAGDAVAMGRSLVASVVSGRRPGAPDAPDSHDSIVDDDRPVAEAAPPPATAKKHGDPVVAGAEPAGSGTGAESGGPEQNPADVAADDRAHDAIVTEPSAVSGPGDDDEIPSPAVQPDDEDIEVTTPVGTTGAGPGVNPDTTESDLQQPGTEPLMDPSTTKRIKSESDTLRKASDPQK
jgi:hypothetical protein